MGSVNVMTQGSRLNPAFDLTRVEDYLEVVYDLVQTKGYAGSTDIAERLGVKTPSVTNMLQKLDGMGLIVYERYRGLRLTAKGEEMARFIKQKHVYNNQIPSNSGSRREQREVGREGIEHHVHKDTVNRMERFVDFVGKHPSWFKVYEDAENRRLTRRHRSRHRF